MDKNQCCNQSPLGETSFKDVKVSGSEGIAAGLNGHLGVLIDGNVLAVLPSVAHVVRATPCGESAWAKATRIDVVHEDGSEESYFIKVSVGHAGREALKGEFESTAAIYAIVPDFCSKPIAWGTFTSDKNSHFYVCKFYNFTEGVIEPESFCDGVARLHSSHTSKTGMFGFHVVTYNGNIPQDNSWDQSWESFFAKGLRHVLKIREERAGGPSAELDELIPDLFGKVIPRLLRPLESHGRKIVPSLVHGDLWCGNVGIVNPSTGQSIIYDPSSFWAHNEYELGNWRHARNKFTDHKYFEEYHKHIPEAEPQGDAPDRNALYALRFNLHAAAMFPSKSDFLSMVIDEISTLNNRYSNGYNGE